LREAPGVGRFMRNVRIEEEPTPSPSRKREGDKFRNARGGH